MTTENPSEVAAATTSVESTSENAPEVAAPAAPTGLDALKAQAKSAPQSAAPSAQAADPSAPVVPAPFQPNLKFKASNKEYEIDEWMRGAIKDPDTEKKAKDILTKAYAFDDYKSRNENMNQSMNQVLSEYSALDKDVSRVMNFKNQGDYDNFFAALKIPKEDVFTWVKKQLELEAATPEQRKAYDMIIHERQRSQSLENETSQVQEQYQQMALQTRTMQLDMELMKPDVSQKAAAWDEKVGQLGAFRDAVIGAAKLELATSQRDLSAGEAVQSVLHKYGKFLEGGSSAAVVPSPETSAVQNVVTKPVIPTIAGKGTSPVTKKPKSIDDLRAMGKDLAAQGR